MANSDLSAFSRTDKAERFVEEFLAMPFVREAVYRSPNHLDPNKKEAVDFLIHQNDLGFLISQKCQQKPQSRNAARTASWVGKTAHVGDEKLILC